MQGTINDIWNVVDELVDENLDNILEQELGEANENQTLENPVKEFEDDTLEEYEPDWGFEEEGDLQEDMVSWNPSEDKIDYWMQEFKSILGDNAKSTKQIESNGLSPILLGGGAILLLGLITSAAVVIKIKSKPKTFRTLPVVEEMVAEQESVEKEEASEIKRIKGPFPFFHFRLPVPLVNKRREVS